EVCNRTSTSPWPGAGVSHAPSRRHSAAGPKCSYQTACMMNSCSVAVEWNSGQSWQHGVDQAAAVVEQFGIGRGQRAQDELGDALARIGGDGGENGVFAHGQQVAQIGIRRRAAKTAQFALTDRIVGGAEMHEEAG